MIGFLLLFVGAVVFTAALIGFAYVSGDRSLDDEDAPPGFDQPTIPFVRPHRKEWL